MAVLGYTIPGSVPNELVLEIALAAGITLDHLYASDVDPAVEVSARQWWSEAADDALLATLLAGLE